MATKKTTPGNGIMQYAPVTTKKKATTGSTSSVASKGAATVKKQPITSKKPTTTQKQASNKQVQKSTSLPEVKVTAKKMTPASNTASTTAQKTVSKDKYRYFMGPTDMSKPTKEVDRATYEKGGMPRIKVLATDTATINNLNRSRGNMSSKGYIPLATKTTPKKKIK